MLRPERKNVVHAFFAILLLMGFLISTGCDLTLGGTPVDSNDDNDGNNGNNGTSVDIERISISSNGTEANNGSFVPAISSGGRFIAFESDATNLVANDTNNDSDIFVRDRDTDEDGIFDEPGAVSTERVSIASDGTQADNDSYEAAISSDGRFVAFESFATNLVASDTNNTSDIFVHDRQTGTTERVSIASDGTEANNGSFVPAISSDGRFVAFESSATNLVGGDNNNSSDIFVHDRDTDEDGNFDEPLARSTDRVSIASDGTQADDNSFGVAISSGGRFVAFESNATNLVGGDNNNSSDIFVHDRDTDEDGNFDEPLARSTDRVSIASDGTQANNNSFGAAISSGGRFVAFESNATNLVANDTNGDSDIFVHDRDTDEDGNFDEPLARSTERVSIASDGTQANNNSFGAAISSDGRFVAFESDATNLVSQDTNATEDTFVRDRVNEETRRVSLAFDGSEGDGSSFIAVISGDGQFVAFVSFAENLVNDDTNGFSDIFVTPNPLSP